MSDKYPRIYSLSTIGIKQHFNCDYRFHPLRTDFSGESGSGKSMVADMIQLILVGSSVYKSSTESNKARDPKGMVLQAKKKYSVGYIFLNIEIATSKYIAIGSYIESSHNKVIPFIIQNGYDWEENLTYLNKPIFFKELLPNDRLLPIDTLIKDLDSFNMKTFNRKDFHRILYRNEILSLDLNKGKTLENYASILRSFSRGKGFKTDSESLKKFLFGNDDHLRLQSKFKEEIQAINNDFFEHNRYQKEIELINSKQKSIDKVLELNKQYNKLKSEFLTNSVIFWSQKESICRSEREQLDDQYSEQKIKLLSVEIQECEAEIYSALEIKKKLDAHRSRLDVLKREDVSQSQRIKEIEPKHDSLKGQMKTITKVKDWLEKSNGDIKELVPWYNIQKDKLLKADLLNQFTRHLEKNKIRLSIESLQPLLESDRPLEKLETKLKDLQIEIQRLEALKNYSDFDNPLSLGKWAIDNLQFPLSKEVESLLIYFQEFPRDSTKDVQRYLKSPDLLFNKPNFEDKSDSDFWVNLDGVLERVKYVKERILDKSTPSEVMSLLEAFKGGIESELNTKTNELDRLSFILEKLNEFQNLLSAINLFKNRDEVLTYRPSDIAYLSKDEVESAINHYKNRIEIEEAFKSLDKRFKQVLGNQSNYESEISRLTSSIKNTSKELSKLLDGEDFDQFTLQKRAIIQSKSIELEETEVASRLKPLNVQQIKDKLGLTSLTLLELSRLKSEIQLQHSSCYQDLKSADQKLDTVIDKVQRAKDKYFLGFGEPLDESQFGKNHSIENPDDALSEEYIRSEEAFKKTFDLAVENTDEGSDSLEYNVGALAHKLLPTIFFSSKIDEDKIPERIAHRLEKLTRDVQEIGSRKVEILKRVLTEVYNKYNEYLEITLKIDHYLRNENRTITGGNRASLRYKSSTDFPIKWMAPFRKQLTEELNNFGIFESLKNEIDIHDMMLKAFKAERGSHKATPEELLDPKSYFDLDFELKLQSGLANAGSQGQTYTGNALLGLARLSLIKNQDRRGIKIMPIDEAEGLGGNYNMLNKLARDENFQILSMSIETAGDIEVGDQYIYIMNENNLADEDSYVPPLAIFSDGEIQVDLGKHTFENS
ncbi:MAG: hypothetical protein HEP71_22590 [Roseivirga sp.]|nr:hypothetical protein [Roseivirga sp.]